MLFRHQHAIVNGRKNNGGGFMPDKRKESFRFSDTQISFRVSSFEHAIIMNNYKNSGASSFRDFAVNVLSDGFLLQINTSDLHDYAYEINKIGININQITHKVNMLDDRNIDTYLLKQYLEECQFLMNEITKTVKRHWIS